jgi:hypothetical protein
MASIPLAINPAPQNPGPLDMAQGGLNVQRLINAVQLQKQTEAQNALQQQSAQIQLQQQQRDQQDQQAIRELAPKFVGKDENGNGTFDYDGFSNAALQRTGNPNLVNQLRMQRYQMIEAASKAGKEQLSNEQEHNKAAYEVIEGVKGTQDPNERQQAYATGLNRLRLLGMDTSHLPASAPDDKALEAYESQLGMHGQLLADAKTQAETKEKDAEAAQKDWQKFENMGVMVNTKTGEQRTITGGVMPPGQLEGKYVALQTQKNTPGAVPLNAEQNAFLKSYERMKELVPQYNFNLANNTGGVGGSNAPADVAKRFGMTPEAFDQAAEKYVATGNLPPVGRGPNGMALQRALMNRGGELHPGEALAANSAEFKANEASLKKLQTNFDGVNAFENTALKNLDQVALTGSKVPDLGTRFANVPVRMISAQMLGTPEMAQFRTALLTAQTEAAKVLASANATGVLSDSARHEAQEVLDGNLPFPAMMASINQLKTDFANRHESYANQISDIQKRLGNKNATPQADATAKPANHPFFEQYGGVALPK